MIYLPRNNEVLEISVFEALRARLLAHQGSAALDHPLAVWANAEDQSLPLILMGRTLRQIVSMPFERIRRVRSIGPKKLGTLLRFLDRAAVAIEKSTAASKPLQDQLAQPPCDGLAANAPLAVENFQAEIEHRGEHLSCEEMWDTWRLTVLKHSVAEQHLGLYVRSLLDVPSTTWDHPLKDLARLTLPELHNQRVFGRRRITAVQEVFSRLHGLLAGCDESNGFTVSLRPARVSRIEHWLVAQLEATRLANAQEVLVSLTNPLVEQIEVDGGSRMASMVRGFLRLTKEKPANYADPFDVRSRYNGHYRRRIAAILHTRWPSGIRLINILTALHQSEINTRPELEQLRLTCSLFSPVAPRLAAEATLSASA